jgi:putative cell wall-binding protein
MPERRKTASERKPAARKTIRKPARKVTARKAAASSSKRWSQRVTRESDALDLKQGVFKLTSPRKIAASLKRSAEHSSRRKTGAYRSALSMLTFYINRAGKTLPKTQRSRLERAKVELKRQFGRDQESQQ